MHAKCRGEVYVAMCPEAREGPEDDDCCWRLEKAMYGTRSAAPDWQHEIKRQMTSIGFIQGRSNPCLYFNPATVVACLVHGDDFFAVGAEAALVQIRDQFASVWKIKHTHVGEADHLSKEMRVLNRIIRVHPKQGIYACEMQGGSLRSHVP